MKKYLSIISMVFLMVVFCSVTANAWDPGKIVVKDEDELHNATKRAVGGEHIVLNKDMNMWKNINVDDSIKLDLNGHKIKFSNDSSILVGNFKSHIEYESKYQQDCYEYVDGVRRSVSGKWITEGKNVIEEEDVNVCIENGTIIGSDGADGLSKRWSKNGRNGSPALIMRSGKLKLKDVSAYGGNGGNGEDGSWDIGRGAGNGGNGANAIKVNRAKKFVAENCDFHGGRGGRAGEKDNTGWTAMFCSKGTRGKDADGLYYDKCDVKDLQIIE